MYSSQLDFQRILQQKLLNKHKERNSKNDDSIQPWENQTGNFPQQLLNTQTKKFQKGKKIMKRHASLQLNPINQIKLPLKSDRLSKQLPKMDIGNINLIRAQSREKILNNINKKRRKSQTTLPSLSVKRNLMIERKLYILRNQTQSNTKSSPKKRDSPRKYRLRNFVESHNY